MKHLLEADECFEIRPAHIRSDTHLWDTVGKYWGELSAVTVLKFCQQRGNWYPFTRDEIDTFHRENGHRARFRLNRLTTDGWIVKQGDFFYITPRFIVKLFKMYPLEWRG